MSEHGEQATAGRATLRQQQKQRTRRDLLESAKRQFIERGYAAVTVDDIASAVGCSRATFYLHFSGKPDVLQKVGAETLNQRALTVYQDLDAVLSTGDRAAFADWVRRALAWFEANQAILPAWDEAVALEPDFQPIARRAIDDLPAAMPEYLRRWGEQRREEASLRIELLVSQLERFFVRWRLQGTISSTLDASEVLADIWFPALRAPDSREQTTPNGNSG